MLLLQCHEMQMRTHPKLVDLIIFTGFLKAGNANFRNVCPKEVGV